MVKILIVEDDILTFTMYQKAFSLEGFESEVATNGKIGLEKLKTYKPDVILLDIKMPIMNGVEMLQILKSDPKMKDIPVVIMTNISDYDVDSEVFTQGVNLTINKSETDPEEVITWIKSIVKKDSAST